MSNRKSTIIINKKKNCIHNWDKPEIEYSRSSSIKNDLFREIDLIKLLINEKNSLFKTILRP
jgi:hypothetical protein